MTRKQLEANCPEGYSIDIPGQNINMLGAKELWCIYENHPEPYLIRIPNDMIGLEAKRPPKEWGRCLYHKVV